MSFTLKCFPFHDWSDWKDIYEGKVMKTIYDDNEKPTDRICVGVYTRQEKICKTCGKKKLQTIKTLL